MRRKVRHHERGSAIIMAVGLLVILALLGTTFWLITHFDRREAGSLATAAPMKQVAVGVLQQIVADRGSDLHFAAGGGPYSAADKVDKTYDHPSEQVDPILASSHPYGGVLWMHVSNPTGTLGDAAKYVTVDGTIALGPNAGKTIEQADITGDGNPDGLRWVDTDGLGYNFPGKGFCDGDAIQYDSGIRDRLGRGFYVAVRVVDASALINANLHYSPSPAAAGKVMPITDVSLLEEIIETVSPGARDSVHQARSSGDTVPNYWLNYALSPLNPGSPPPAPAPPVYAPFDISDMLALSWGGAAPSTGNGRLYTALGQTAYNAAKPYMTTHSTSRCLVIAGRNASGQQATKVDLNSPDPDPTRLYYGFYNLWGLWSAIPEDGRRKLAAQMAVNAWDFRDADGVPLAWQPPGAAAGEKVYGIERQPFITEAGYKLEKIAADQTAEYYAIELYNPYVTAIDMTTWKLKVGSGGDVPLGATTIAAGGRVTIVNDAQVQATGDKATNVALNLKEEARILRPASNGDLVVVGKVRPTDFSTNPATYTVPEPAGTFKAECIRRCDLPAESLYSLALYKRNIPDDITVAGNNLGQPNAVPANEPQLQSNTGAPPLPVPVYVRDNLFVNVGELNRIFFIGPTQTQALDELLVAGGGISPYNPSAATGRLSLSGDILPQSGVPALPLGCMVGDFFMVRSPGTDGWDNDGDGKTDLADDDEDLLYGLININTAPDVVLACLPGLHGIAQAERAKIIQAILDYREMFGPYFTTARSTVVGIPNLRNDPGFACPGEIAIPIWFRGKQNDIAGGYVLPQDVYPGNNQEPRNYTVSVAAQNHDDGLSTAANLAPKGDLVKRYVYYSWLSNHITVRSDLYVAYIRVDLRRPTAAASEPSLAVRRYAAVIDRSNCRTSSDKPHVLMFAEIK